MPPELRGLQPRQRGGVRHPRDGGRAHRQQQKVAEEREGGHRRRDDDRPAKVPPALQVGMVVRIVALICPATI